MLIWWHKFACLPTCLSLGYITREQGGRVHVSGLSTRPLCQVLWFQKSLTCPSHLSINIDCEELRNRNHHTERSPFWMALMASLSAFHMLTCSIPHQYYGCRVLLALLSGWETGQRELLAQLVCFPGSHSFLNSELGFESRQMDFPTHILIMGNTVNTYKILTYLFKLCVITESVSESL